MTFQQNNTATSSIFKIVSPLQYYFQNSISSPMTFGFYPLPNVIAGQNSQPMILNPNECVLILRFLPFDPKVTPHSAVVMFAKIAFG